MGQALSDFAGQAAAALLQHDLEMQRLQAQYDLQMQQLQEQQKLLLEQQQQQEVERQRAEREQKQIAAQRAGAAKRNAIDPTQMADLVRTYPDWRAIVGAVDATKRRPDPNNPFRKWLANKDAAYQTKINGTNDPREIENAITLFRTQTKG